MKAYKKRLEIWVWGCKRTCLGFGFDSIYILWSSLVILNYVSLSCFPSHLISTCCDPLFFFLLNKTPTHCSFSKTALTFKKNVVWLFMYCFHTSFRSGLDRLLLWLKRPFNFVWGPFVHFDTTLSPFCNPDSQILPIEWMNRINDIKARATRYTALLHSSDRQLSEVTERSASWDFWQRRMWQKYAWRSM